MWRWPIRSTGCRATLDAALPLLERLDGVMLGRASYHDPGLLLAVDPVIFGRPAPFDTIFDAVEAYFPYIERQLARGIRLADMTRHMLGLFAGLPGARAFRRHLATDAVKKGAGLEVLRAAIDLVARPARAA